MPTTTVRNIPLTEIVYEASHGRPVSGVNMRQVDRYVARWENGEHGVPPVLVGKRDDHYVLIDGYHRVEMFRLVGVEQVPAVVTTEPENRWEWLSVRDNMHHGLQLSDADRRYWAKRLTATGHDEKDVARLLAFKPKTVTEILREGIIKARAQKNGKNGKHEAEQADQPDTQAEHDEPEARERAEALTTESRIREPINYPMPSLPNVYRVLDEMLRLLDANAIDPRNKAVGLRLERITERLRELTEQLNA